MSRFVRPTHVIEEIRHGHSVQIGTSESEAGAEYVANRFKAAGRDVSIKPVEQSPMDLALREWAA